MRRLGFFLTGLAILVGINVTVWRFEHAISSGETVLLELAPVDPRSLMQGDYMRLSYALARQLGSPHQEGAATQTLVIRLDEQHVERNQRVLHPHADVLWRRVDEDHRLLRLQAADEHESLRAGLRRVGDALGGAGILDGIAERVAAAIVVHCLPDHCAFGLFQL